MSYLAPVLSAGFRTELVGDQDPVDSTGRLISPNEGRYQVVAVHGFALLYGTPFTTELELAKILNGRADSPEHLIKELRGTATITLRDTVSGKYFIITDMFGAGKIFIWQDSARWALASNINDLVSFLRQHDVVVKKSIENAGLLGFVGYGGGAVPTSYEGIDCVDQFHFVEITPSGELFQLEFSFKEDLVQQAGINEKHQKELIQVTADEIRKNVTGFSSYTAESYICQLTGGLDSRVVFAALVGTPYKDQYSTYTYGLEESPDMLIARRLTAEYGMTATSYSGMRSSIVPHDPTLQVLWSLKQTGGLTSMGPASIGGYPRPDSVVLAGGWGEMYRGGYPDFVSEDAPDEEKIKWAVNWILRSGSPYGPRISYGGLFSDVMVERAREYGKQMLREIRELDIGDELLAEWMYLRWSTRFNVAEITRTCLPFAHRADPLCVPSMMKLIYATPLSDRKSGALELDLIRELEPTLEQYPYDKSYLTGEYMKTRDIQGIREFNESLQTEMKWHFDDRPTFLKSANSATRPTDAHKKEALRVKMPLRFVVRAEANREKIRRFARHRSDEMAQVFNLEHLQNVTESNPKSRPEYRRLETLSAAMAWHFDED